jgi:outer membrane protein OmpA-like peptidoglycan-associated protein
MLTRYLFQLLLCTLYVGLMDFNAQNSYTDYQYKHNIGAYTKELKKNPENLDIRHRLAMAYMKTGNSSAALFHYKVLYLYEYSKFSPTDWNNFAQLSLAYGQVIDAAKAFDQLSKYNVKNRFQKKPVDEAYYHTTNLERLNTSFSEFSPIVSRNKLIYTSDKPTSQYDMNRSDWTGTPYLSLFSFDSTKNSSQLFSKELNQAFHLGPASFSSDGTTVFYTRAFKDDKKGLNMTTIYMATLENGKWTHHTPFVHAADKEISFAHPVFLDKLQLLVFSANLSDSKGEMDLYYCKLNNGTWSSPTNFGEKINTSFNEVFPCANPYEPNTLYFSSNGYLGFGGLDIFATHFSNDQWSTPELLPKSINSNFDDFGITYTSPGAGYVSSNRRGGKGGDDIYTFEKESLVLIEGMLVDAQNRSPIINKRLYLINEEGTIVDSVITDQKGHFVFTKMPYQNLSLKPLDEDGIEMVVRPLMSDLPKDPFVNLKMMTSNKTVFDSIDIVQNELITYVLESTAEMKKRCVVYENGDKAVKVTFNVKDKNGQPIDRITTDNNGCLVMKKLYPESTYLELMDELQAELNMRFLEPSENKNTNWINETSDIKITSMQRCVVYEDGAEAVQINFVVKDSTGKVIDNIATDGNGCFSIRKLYNQKTYLDLLEDQLAEMGLKFMHTTDQKNVNWNKQEDKIVLKSPTRCVIYQNGKQAKLVQLDIKDSVGNTLEHLNTDNDGCIKLRKLYGDKAYLELVDEEQAVLRARIQDLSKDGLILLEKVELSGESTLKAQLYDYKNLNKDFTGIKIVFYTEGGLIKKVSTVNKMGEFTYEKMSSKSTVLMMILDEDGVLQGSENIVVKGNVSGSKDFINNNFNTFYILDNDQEKFIFTKLKSSGEFEFNIDLEEYELASRTKEIKSFEEVGLKKENQIVVKNIYFESGKWNLDVAAEKVMDELIVLLRKNPTLSVTINAHTDSKGSAADNLKLSNNRANSVSAYLLSKGIGEQQFLTKGYGETMLLNQCKDNVFCTDEEHAQNRRIEFEFVWK